MLISEISGLPKSDEGLDRSLEPSWMRYHPNMSPDSRPTIGHVLHRLDFAGAEVLAADLARELGDRYRFVFLCLDGIGQLGHKLQGEGFKVVEIRRRAGISFAAARRIRRAVRRYRIDLLHAHQYTPFFYAALSRWGGASPPVLFTEHGRHYPDPRKVRRVLANRVLLRRDDRVTAVGKFVRRMLAENEGIAPRRIAVIRNGIDSRKFIPPTPQQRVEARRLLELPGDVPVVMQVARFHAVKDHATAVRAFMRAHDRVPDARMVFIGDGTLREETEQLAFDLGVAEHCHFVGVRDDVHDLLPAADVFLLSSLSEGISVTLLEAMAAERPIVATDVGGNGEVIDHGDNGLLSPRGDAKTLGHNLSIVLRDASMRQAMGAAGRIRLLRLFTQERMHAAYADVYASMLDGGSRQ